MFVKMLSRIHDPRFSQINYSVIDDELNIDFFVSDEADIADLSARLEDIIFLHNRTNPSHINYEIKNRNIIFTGDVDVIFKTLKEDLFIREELYTHLREDKELNDYLTKMKLEIKKSASNDQTPTQEAKSTSGQMPFFKSTALTPDSPKVTNINSATSSLNTNIPSSEVKKIQQLLETYSALSDDGKKLFVENLAKTLGNENGNRIKQIPVK